jgi:hypothetical protein
MRAPTVVDDGTRPERPMPWAQLLTSGGVTSGGVFRRRWKNGQSIRA